jgi:succinate dehydrogenase assembly factor 2
MILIRKISTNLNNIYRKQLIYRSKQRGWLEVDLILGSWATDNIMYLSESQLKQYEYILNQETLDIYHSITKIKKVEKHIDNEVMQMIRKYVKENIITNTPLKYENNIKYKMSN